MAPLNALVAKMFMSFQIGVNKARDGRVKLTTELLQGVKLVKMLGWEDGINELIGTKRREEMKWIAHGKTIGLLAGVVWTLTPILLPLVTFTVFSMMGGHLTTTTAFTALALFDVLKVPVNLLPQTIQFLTQLAVSMRRIRDLLMAEERKVPDAGGTAILVERATLAWPKKSSEEVPRGALP